jgi:Zn-dependent M28 family amino/carboxypeptidase
VLWVAVVAVVVLAASFWLNTMRDMPLKSHSGPLPPLTAEEKRIAARLREHVQVLAGDTGERNMWHYEALLSSARYIRRRFEDAGHTVRVQEYTVQGKAVANLEVEIRGRSLPDEHVVVGAHYDSVPGCPGANDNASGVAALLELARLFSRHNPERTVRLAAFVNEEPPFFQTDEMGSRVFARAARERGDNIVAFLALETIGCYSDEPDSQSYPPPFGQMYPDRGNFIAFVGNTASRSLVRRCVGSFRSHTAFPSEGIAAPGAVAGVGWSDHWAFWQEGYPGVMVTDTAPFRYAYYHDAYDTPDKIDYDRTARVVAGLHRVVADLAGDGEDR